MHEARVDAVEYEDAGGVPVLHILFEDGDQQVIEVNGKAKVFDSITDDDVPPRLKAGGNATGKAIHEFVGKPVKKPKKATVEVIK